MHPVETRKAPGGWLINLRRTGTLKRDVVTALSVRYAESTGRDHAKVMGWDRSIPSSLRPGSYEHGLHLDTLVEAQHPQITDLRHRMEDVVDHGIVTILPTVALEGLYKGMKIAERARERVRFFQDIAWGDYSS